MKKAAVFSVLLAMICIAGSCFAQKKPIEIDREDFLSRVVNFEKDSTTWNYLGDKPAIIEFYADWCKPCKMMEKPLKQLAKEYAGQIYVYKIDVDKNRELAKQIGINSIPTIIFAPMKGEPRILMGAKSKEDLQKLTDTILLGREE